MQVAALPRGLYATNPRLRPHAGRRRCHARRLSGHAARHHNVRWVNGDAGRYGTGAPGMIAESRRRVYDVIRMVTEETIVIEVVAVVKSVKENE
jgi:hypothetical protein